MTAFNLGDFLKVSDSSVGFFEILLKVRRIIYLQNYFPLLLKVF